MIELLVDDSLAASTATPAAGTDRRATTPTDRNDGENVTLPGWNVRSVARIAIF